MSMEKITNPSINPEVEAVFNSYPQNMIPKLLFLRQLIFETAVSLNNLGDIEETLKWGEPSYLTKKSNMGSTVRLGWKAKKAEQYSIFFKCTANLVPAFKEKFPQTFTYGGDRSIDFHLNNDVPVTELKQCIALALTYHRNKKLDAAERWKTVSHIQ